MHNTINTYATKYLWLFGFTLLLASQSVHADFRKAVDAYIARDGATVLSEVKDAVDTKNNEGLALFLSAINIDASTSRQKDIARIWGGNTAKHMMAEADVKTTLSVILTEQQQNELFNALQIALDRSSADIQYGFGNLNSLEKYQQKDGRQRRDEFAKKGSYVASLLSASSLEAKAEIGDPMSQLNLGFKYLNFESDWGYGCSQETAESICQTKDEEKGYYWLKQALMGLEQRRFEGIENFGVYADSMCDFFNRTANGDKLKLRQAYLWCLVGINSGSYSSWRLLNEMNKSGNLKIAAPEIDAIWGMSIQQDRDRLAKSLNLTEFKELPDGLIEARKQLIKDDAPVFSYYFSDYRLSPYLLDIYADGRVNITFSFLPNTNGDLLMKVSQKTVKNFLKDLKKLDFNHWTLFTTSGQFCDNFDPCIWTYVKATQREGNNLRKVMIREPAYLADIVENNNNLSTLRVAKLNTLIEQYFPTQNMRCRLGNSEGFIQACLARDARWAELAKRTIKEKH